MKFLGIPIPFVRQPAPPHDPALLDKVLELAVENALLKAKPRRAIRKDAGVYKTAKAEKSDALRRCISRPEALALAVDEHCNRDAEAA